jgi:hypothetical protein
LAATVDYYPQLESLQLGTTQKLAGNLNNQFTRDARAQIDSSLALQRNMTGEAGRLSGMGARMEEFARQNFLDSGPTAAEQNIQGLGQSAMGVMADQIVAPTDIRNVEAINAQAARMGAVRDVQGVNAQRVGDVRSRNVGSGALGGSLLSEAQRRVESGGRLSAEASRDAVQSARAGMAARGMATGSSGLAAELLNRDRYARTRDMENLGFAQNVQNADVQRQMSNADMALQAARGNQAMAGQMSLADQAAMMDAQRLNQASDLTRGQTDAQFAQQVALSNQAAGMDAERLNQSRDQILAGMSMDAQQANQSANMNQREMNRAFMLNANQAFNQGTIQRRDQAAQQAALGGNLMQGAGALYGNAANIGFAGAQNLTALDPYARAMGVGMQSAGNTQADLQQGIGQTYNNALGMAGNVASFNSNAIDSRYNSYMNNQAARQAANTTAGATRQAAMFSMIGNILSDRREKTDVKPLGQTSGVLGLKVYEYRYKGDDEKRKGFMAQDVARVLPEAVAEVEYQGKKRLAIKPQIIGQALARELTRAAA